MQQRHYIAIALLSALVWLAGFGLSQMNGHGASMSMHESGCIGTALAQTDCPLPSNVNDFIAFHFQAFQFFSTATLDSLGLTWSVIGLVLLFAFWHASGPSPNGRHNRLGSLRRESFLPLWQNQLWLQWLARLEHSPARF